MKSRKFFPLFSVFRSVLSLAGLLFARIASAETITLPTPYYTNQFTTVESWVQLDTVPAVVLTEEQRDEWIPDIISSCSGIIGYAEDFYYEVYDHVQEIHDLFYDFEQNARFPDNITDEFIEDWENLSRDVSLSMSSYQREAYGLITSVTNNAHFILSVAEEIDNLPVTNQIVSVSFGQEFGYTQGGFCHCPDYTVYLQGLHADLVQMRGDLARYFDWLEDFREGWRDIISSSSLSGEMAATLLRQWWEVMRIRPLDEPSSGWDPAENLRNFIRWGFVFPTNTVDRPLWVMSADDDGLSVRIVNTNAIKVSITNDYSGLAITNIEEITTNYYSNAMDHATNDVQAIEDEYGQVEEDRTPLRDTLDIRATSDDSTAMLEDGWFSGWRDFFSLEFECPTYVPIHEGWTWYMPQFGSSGRRSRRDGSGEVLAEIQSMRWDIGENQKKVLSFVRACVSLFLAFVYIRILIFSVRFDAQLLGLLARIMYSLLVNGRDLPKVSADVVNLWGDFVTSLFGGDEAAYRS